jgi:hypothetical protein
MINGESHPKFRDPNDIREFMVGLVKLWDRDRDDAFEMKAEYALGPGVLIWSLTNHTVELSRDIISMSERGRYLTAMPLVRLSMECAITAAWSLVAPGAAGGIVHEGVRQRRAVIAEIVRNGAYGFDATSLAKAESELADVADKKMEEAKFIEKRFFAMHSGRELYTSYRVASSLSHAGMTLADSYLKDVGVSVVAPLGVAFQPDQELEPAEAWLGTAASMLVLAMKACNEIDGRGRHKTQLKKAAKKLGVSMEIRLADFTN